MHDASSYDVAVIGGGLAGLSLSIMLARKNYRVILFEKEQYPFHKVCGEYISLESYDLLVSLGLPLPEKHYPIIKHLHLSSPSGTLLKQELPLGGFGVSRFALDEQLATIARNAGVELMDNTRVDDIVEENAVFSIRYNNTAVTASLACGAFGKRSNIDVKWKRNFIQRKANALNNFIGVKYHAILNHPRDRIDLHNFQHGYCGISPVEEGKTCICYLTTAKNLNDHGNNINRMEEELLCRNPFLQEAFGNATIVYDKPLVISQISFDQKQQVENAVLMLGDAAGMIAPLCGNGMSMALHSSRIAAKLIPEYLAGNFTRQQLHDAYTQQWKASFSRRLRAGRIIQTLFYSNSLVNASIGVLRLFPPLVSSIIRQTHG